MTTVQELKIQLLPRLRRAFKELGCHAVVQHQFSSRYQPDDLLVSRGPDHAFVEIVKAVRATDVKRLKRTRTYTYSRSTRSMGGLPSAFQKIMGTPGGIVFLALVAPTTDPSRWAGETPVRCETYGGMGLDALAIRLVEHTVLLLDERRRLRELEVPARSNVRTRPGRGPTPAGSSRAPPARHDPVDSTALDSMVFSARGMLPDHQSVEDEINLVEDEIRHGHVVAACLHLARAVEALLLGLVREWDASGGIAIFERVQSLQNQLHEIQIELARLSLSPAPEPPSDAQTGLSGRGRKLIEGLFELYRNSGERDTRKKPRNPPSIDAAYHAIRRQLSRLPACCDVFRELDAEGVIGRIVDDRNAIAHVRDVATPGDDHRRASRMLTLSKKLFDALARVDTARKAPSPPAG